MTDNHRVFGAADSPLAGHGGVLARLLALHQEVIAVAALTIRNLDEQVKRRLQIRAARHGRSMEAEVREILAETVREPDDSAGLFTAILDRFGDLGGVELKLPERRDPARGVDFS